MPRLLRSAALVLVAALVLSSAYVVYAWTSVPVKDDPLVRMPGTQPGQVSLEAPNRCLNCHAGYNTSVEPGHNWQGSMMSQSARDPLFWSAMTAAAQDSIWATGRPNATDICLRCHFPTGWLESRSDPTNASLMTGADFDGVQCDLCHRMVDPHFATTYDGTREGDDWAGYWDESNASGSPSQPAADATFAEDALVLQDITLFDGSPAYLGNLPVHEGYTEATSGQYVISPDAAKRASFADAEARHQMSYSRFHKSKYLCSTCHDVSNPVLANLGQDPTTTLPSEDRPAYAYFHAERTFSEFMLSDYGQPGGASGIGPFAPDVYETSRPGNAIAACQDCHMRDVVGTGADKRGVPLRPDDSVEHPNSGQPLHDMTGGNMWVGYLLASAVLGSPNYDSFNEQQLGQGPSTLTLDLTQGQGLNPDALLAGVDRARQQLELAASIENLSYNASTGDLSFRVQNQTGHKLISGFPEGRRMFVNVRAYAGGALIAEVNPYDAAAATLKGLPLADQSPPLDTHETYVDALVYETHASSDDDVPNTNGFGLTDEAETFHFALATGRYKDNRIPPRGFRIDQAAERLAEPVWHGSSDVDYFTAAEYAGGYDDVSLSLVPGADTVEVSLYYQTTSREYVEFLRSEINGTGGTLTGTGAGGDAPYIAQEDPFFTQLSAWGETIWQLWLHNNDVPGAAPVLMTTATAGGTGGACTAPTPELSSAVPDHQQVTLTWTDVYATDPSVVGHRVYYDQGGKAQLVAEVGLTTTYIDTGLTNGETYCYKVTSLTTDCESAASDVLCAVPDNQSLGVAGVSELVTGLYETTGKGKSQTTVFVTTSSFTQGDTVVVRALVLDAATDLPVAGAKVEIAIDGPATAVVSANTDEAGVAAVTWQTTAPNRKGNGGTATGSYTAVVSDIAATGYTWDGVATEVEFTLE
ncbi:MAG: multiheme c-type cytochrome [Anaerolineae bacterium]